MTVDGRKVKVWRYQPDADVFWVYGWRDVVAWPVAGCKADT